MSDRTIKNNMASRSRRMANRREKFYNSANTNSRISQKENKNKHDNREKKNRDRKAEEVNKKEQHKIREIFGMSNWASWMSWKTISTRKQLKYDFKSLDKVRIDSTITLIKIRGGIKHTNIRYDTYQLKWEEALVEHRTRRFIRHIFNAIQTARWQSQMRTQVWEQRRGEIDWETFFEYINYKCEPNKRETSPKNSKLKAFKIKMMLEELPTNEVKYN